MTSAVAQRFAALPTAAKLLLILTAALLPIGIGLVWVAESGIRDANLSSQEITRDQARTAARAIESLIARNALALRIAANGALSGGAAGACDQARQLSLIEGSAIDGNPRGHSFTEWPLGNGQLTARIGAKVPQVTTLER